MSSAAGCLLVGKEEAEKGIREGEGGKGEAGVEMESRPSISPDDWGPRRPSGPPRCPGDSHICSEQRTF